MLSICQLFVESFMTTRSSGTRPFEALANPYRRQLLLALLAENPEGNGRFDPLELLQVGESPEDVDSAKIALHHHHLPKLADMGMLEWEQASGKIATGPAWDDIAPLLQLLYDNRSDLSDGVLSGVSPDD